MSNSDIIYPISASLCKKFFFKGSEKEICAWRIYQVDILKRYREQTLSMLKGSYFETGCIGKGVNETITLDLPRKKLKQSQVDENRIAELKYKTEHNGSIEGFVPPIIGEKTVDQERIDNQILVFKKECIEKGIAVTEHNVQLTIYKYINGILCKGTLDLFPVFLDFGDIKNLLNIDLKLTKDISGTYPAEFAWGDPDRMDHTQADMYSELVIDIDFKLNSHLRQIISPETEAILNKGQCNFAYWIFDYKENGGNKWVFSAYNGTKQKELFETIRKTDNLVNDFYPREGWPKSPKWERCKDCPVSDCDQKEHFQTI